MVFFPLEFFLRGSPAAENVLSASPQAASSTGLITRLKKIIHEAT